MPPIRLSVKFEQRFFLPISGHNAVLAFVALLWLGIAVARGPQPRAQGAAAPELAASNHEESSVATHARSERIRIEFENSTSKPVTVGVRAGAGACSTNRLIVTQEIKGDSGFVVFTFTEPSEAVCYLATPGGSETSSSGEWQTIKRSIGSGQEGETYRVKLP